MGKLGRRMLRPYMAVPRSGPRGDGVLFRFKPAVQYYQSQSWFKVGPDVPLVLFAGRLELELPLLYPSIQGDTAVVRRKHALRWMVSFGTQHRYPSMRQVRDSDVAQVDLLRSVN